MRFNAAELSTQGFQLVRAANQEKDRAHAETGMSREGIDPAVDGADFSRRRIRDRILVSWIDQFRDRARAFSGDRPRELDRAVAQLEGDR